MDSRQVDELRAVLPVRYSVRDVLAERDDTATFLVEDAAAGHCLAVARVRRLSVGGDPSSAQEMFGSAARVLCGAIALGSALPYTSGTVSLDGGGAAGYLVSQFVAGKPLSEIEFPCDPKMASEIGVRIARALGDVHRQGVLHLDLKPENIIVRGATSSGIDENSSFALIDFSARPGRGDSSHQTLCDVSLPYLAPELSEGNEATPRSDLFSLGVILYEMVVGRRPFAGRHGSALLRQQRNAEFRSVGSLALDLCPRFAATVDALLEPNPANRPQSSEDVVARLAPDSLEVEKGLSFPDGFGLAAPSRQRLLREVGSIRTGNRTCGDSPLVELIARSGTDLSSILREIADRAECEGAVIFSAHLARRDLGGLTEQLGAQLDRQLRGRTRRGAEHLAHSAAPVAGAGSRVSNSDVLDDLAIASRHHDCVVVIDSEGLFDVSDYRFVDRAVRHARQRDGASSLGSTFIVLGSAHSLGPEGTESSLLEVIPDAVLDVGQIDGEDLRQLADLARVNTEISLAHCKQIVAAAAGDTSSALTALAGAIAALRDGVAVEEAVGAALAAMRSSSPADQPGDASSMNELMSLLESSWPSLEATGMLEIMLRQVGQASRGNTAASGSSRTRAPKRLSRRANSHAWDLAVFSQSVHGRFVEAFGEAVRATWRDWSESDWLVFSSIAAEFDAVTPRCKWVLVKSLMRMLAVGEFAAVENFSLYAHASARSWSRSPIWALFGAIARLGTGRGPRFEFSLSPIDVECRPLVRFHADWVQAMWGWKSRSRDSALDDLERAIRDAHAAGVSIAASYHVEVEIRRIELRGPVGSSARLLRTDALRIRSRSSLSASQPDELRRNAWYLRLRARLSLFRRRFAQSAAWSARETCRAQALGFTHVAAAALNNGAVALSRCGELETAAALLNEAADLRKHIDDERGVAASLGNLGLVHLRLRNYSEATSALLRARLVANRNGLVRLATATTINLALSQFRLGRLRDAYHTVARHAVSSTASGDGDLRVRAQVLAGTVALDLGYVFIAERHLEAAVRLGPRSLETRSFFAALEVEVAFRRDGTSAAVASALAHRVDLPDFDDLVRLFASESPDASAPRCSRVRRDVPHADSDLLRIRFLNQRCSARSYRVSISSVQRVVRWCATRGLVRPALVHLARFLSVARDAGSLGEYSRRLADRSLPILGVEGHDELRIEVQVLLATGLAERAHAKDVTRLLRDSVRRMEILERWGRHLGTGASAASRSLDACLGATRTTAADHRRDRRSPSIELAALAFELSDRAVVAEGDERAVVGSDSLACLAQGAFDDSELEGVVARLRERARELSGAARCLLFRAADSGSRPGAEIDFGSEVATAGRASGVSRAVVCEVFRTRREVTTSDALTDDELTGHRSISDFGLRSLAAFPLVVGSRCFGVLYLDHLRVAGIFGVDELAALSQITAQVAACLEIKRLQGISERSGEIERLAEDEFFRMHRMALAAELINGRAHDLKNVLAAIVGRCQLARRGELAPESERSMRAAESAASAGSSLLERLLSVSRGGASASTGTKNLSVVLKDCVDLVRPRLREGTPTGIELCMGEAAELPASAEQAADFQDLLMNLLVNACDAMPEGGTLVVESELDDVNSVFELRLNDTGHGMSEATQSKMFDPFFTTKGDEGTGLGLVVVRRALARWGGRLAVESELNRGTSMTLRMPVRSLEKKPDFA